VTNNRGRGGVEDRVLVVPEPGRYWMAVFTADSLAGGNYGVVMQLYRQTSGTPVSLPLERPSRTIQVRGQEIVLSDLTAADVLDLYNVGGCLIRSWTVPAGRSWRVSLRQPGLASGVYFARIRHQDDSARKLVIVR
jgi:hypothetical protein